MEIIEKNIDELIPYENNPRKNDEAVEKVMESIERFGFNVPIIVSQEGEIIAGHTRYEAAKQIGLNVVPCIVVSGLTDGQIRQLRIVDNKTAELASWDYGKLAIELESIPTIDVEMFEFDFSNEYSEEEELASNLDEGVEIDLTEFSDESFDHECPYCGFRWNK